MFFELLAGLLIVILVYVLFQHNLLPHCICPTKYINTLNAIPGPPGLPIIGYGWEVAVPHEELLGIMAKEILRFRSPTRVWVLGVPYVFLAEPEDVEVLLSSPKFLPKSAEYNVLHPWLGLGLLTSKGKRWNLHRKILTPAFHFKILEQFVDVFTEQCKVLLQKLSEHLDKDYVKINSLIDLCSLDIICESTMGTCVNAQNKGHVEYTKATKRITQIFHSRMMYIWLWNDHLYKLTSMYREQKKVLNVLHSFTDKVIRERKAEYRALGPVAQTEETFTRKRRLAFLDLLIEMAEKEGLLSDRDIREQVDTFMFEGHDTVSTAISWALHLLGRHPDIQEKAVEELQDIFGDSDRAATYNDLQNMKYLEQVIKEALRLYPSVPFFSRALDVDVQFKQYTVPAGTTIVSHAYILHRHVESFPDPEKFDPERFSPENCLGRHPYAYLPFSAGPRNCIGQRFAMLEEKAVISSVLRKFKLESLDKPEDIKLVAEVVLRPKEELKIKLSPRLS